MKQISTDACPTKSLTTQNGRTLTGEVNSKTTKTTKCTTFLEDNQRHSPSLLPLSESKEFDEDMFAGLNPDDRSDLVDYEPDD